jgi:5'-nucleotidase
MLTIAVSSRALFHTEDGDKIFQSDGAEAFNTYMRSKEGIPLRPGPAFNLVRKLLAMNTSEEHTPRDRVEVVLLSRNSPDAGLRIMHSIMHYELDIERAVFSQGGDRFRYATAFGAHLFLSTNSADVVSAMNHGVAAATMVHRMDEVGEDSLVRIAFDGDSVLFSNEADYITQTQGLKAFQLSEQAKVNTPLQAGPFKGFITELQKLQASYPAEEGPLRVGLFTARGIPAHERALRTLRSWGIRLDEALFSGGLPKGPFLKAFGADVFFDDTRKHVESASLHDVPAGHVPYGNGQGIFLEGPKAAA